MFKVKGHDKFITAKPRDRTTWCRLPYGITECYLPPDASEQ